MMGEDMLKFIMAVVTLMLSVVPVRAEVSYREEMQSLGSVAGQGLACNASKYHTFELLARAILITKASSDEEQAEGMRIYNEFKANAFISKIKDNMADCGDIAAAFDRQQIFKFTLYGDGTIKMPDGKIISPRRAYDATLVYKKEPGVREKYMDMYTKQMNKIQRDPAYQKALRERQLQEGF